MTSRHHYIHSSFLISKFQSRRIWYWKFVKWVIDTNLKEHANDRQWMQEKQLKTLGLPVKQGGTDRGAGVWDLELNCVSLVDTLWGPDEAGWELGKR